MVSPSAAFLQTARKTAVRAVAGAAVIVGGLEYTTELPSQGRSAEAYHRLSDEWLTPLLRHICNPEQAHHLAIQLLRDYPHLAPTHRPSAVEQGLNVQQQIPGTSLRVRNCIGLAAGFDKDAEGLDALLDIGFGFIEVGSVCRREQPGNPSPRMFRLLEDDAIINRYGLNSQGSDIVQNNLKTYRQEEQKKLNTSFGEHRDSPRGLVGVNLGKNKETRNPREDYQDMIRSLGPMADYLVINVSCPNQKGMEELQSTDSMEYLLEGCYETRQELARLSGYKFSSDEAETTSGRRQLSPPLFIKLSPDLNDDGDQTIKKTAATLLKLYDQGMVDGVIISNTTINRPNGLQSEHRHESGGLSGRPLTQKSTEVIRSFYALTEGKIPIIGVGGIFTAHDVFEKLKAGACLVQLYTGMVIQGPGTVSKIRNELAILMKENGFHSIDQVVGLDHEELYWKRRLKTVTEKPNTENIRIFDSSNTDKGEAFS